MCQYFCSKEPRRDSNVRFIIVKPLTLIPHTYCIHFMYPFFCTGNQLIKCVSILFYFLQKEIRCHNSFLINTKTQTLFICLPNKSYSNNVSHKSGGNIEEYKTICIDCLPAQPALQQLDQAQINMAPNGQQTFSIISFDLKICSIFCLTLGTLLTYSLS